jgi:hypothetical protein
MPAGRSYTCFTPELTSPAPSIENYAWFFAVGRSFEFKLQACTKAEIILAVTPLNNNTDGYRISLGGRSSVTRLSNADRTASAETDGLLSCHALRSFWITWFENTVKVGFGKMNSNAIVELQDPESLAIAALSLNTGESQGGGEWQVSWSIGELACVFV